jgi:hypothetical protein
MRKGEEHKGLAVAEVTDGQIWNWARPTGTRIGTPDNRILTHDDLSQNEYRLYLFLAQFGPKRPWITGRQEWLADHLKLGLRSVNRILRSLVSRRLLIPLERPGKTTLYRFAKDPDPRHSW